MRAIVVTFDRLPLHMLSCYGHEWIETPQFNRLAARSSVFDWHFAELPGPAGPAHGWWTGRYEFFAPTTPTTAESSASLFERLQQANVTARLLSERDHSLPVAGLAATEIIGGEIGLEARHDQVPFARLIQRGLELLSSPAEQPELLWLHSHGVPDPWLPPEFFAGLYLDELEDLEEDAEGTSGRELADDILEQLRDDPNLAALLLSGITTDEDSNESDDNSRNSASQTESTATHSPSSSTAPTDSSSASSDFGEYGRLIARLVFAGYVSLIDHCLKPLLDWIDQHEEEVLLIVTAARGHSFQERETFLADLPGGIASAGGNINPQLTPATLHVPLIIRRTGRERLTPIGTRHTERSQPLDVAATLLDWFNVPNPNSNAISLLPAVAGELIASRDIVPHLSNDGELAVGSRHWHLIAGDRDQLQNESPDADHSAALFALPEDPWLIHNQAAQFPDEVERLRNVLRERLR